MSKRTEWCKHYNGVASNECCKAGVRYATVEAARDPVPLNGRRKALACLPEWNEDGASTCDRFELRTPEEIAAYEKAMQERFENTCKARGAIVAHLGGPWKRGMPGSAGKIDCPVCGGAKSLAFSRAGYNGHIHAACATSGCVSWME